MGKLTRLVLILIIAVFINSACSSDSDGLVGRGMLGEITDPGEYSKIIDEAGENPSLNHFPSDIPANAEVVRFHFHPSVFQGGTVLQLRVRLSANEVKEIYSEFIDKSEYVFQAPISDEEATSLEETRIPYFYTSDDGSTEWPDGYEILVLGSESYGSEDAPWNHGLTYGISISFDESEIVYWYDDW